MTLYYTYAFQQHFQCIVEQVGSRAGIVFNAPLLRHEVRALHVRAMGQHMIQLDKSSSSVSIYWYKSIVWYSGGQQALLTLS